MTRRWREKNPEAARASELRWRANNPEKAKEIARTNWLARRARLRNALVPGHPVIAAEIFARDGGLCHLCGKQLAPDNWELDHVIPLNAGVEAGGVHAPWNVAVSCMPCNRRKGAKYTPPDIHVTAEHLVIDAEIVD